MKRLLMEAAHRTLAYVTRRAGYRLCPVAAGPTTMEGALAHFAPRFEVSTVIDVGASNGCWTEIASRYWPSASYLLIEAQRVPHEPALRDIKGRRPNVDYVLAAAGSRTGTIHFDASDPFGGHARDLPGPGRDIEVPVTTLDYEVERRGLTGPFLVKLDTHGYEVEIFEGARRVLAQTALLVVEAYNFTLSGRALRFPQLCGHLERSGFRPIGIVDLMYRPKDGALWQFDFLFARSDRPEFQLARYE